MTTIGSALIGDFAGVAALGDRAVRIDARVHRHNDGAMAFWASAGFAADTDDGRWSLLV